MDRNNSTKPNNENSNHRDIGMILGWVALITGIISLAIAAIVGIIGLFFSISSFRLNRQRKALIGIFLNSLPVLGMVIVIFYSI